MSISTRKIVLALNVGECAVFEGRSNMHHTLTTHSYRASFKCQINKLQAIDGNKIATFYRVRRIK